MLRFPSIRELGSLPKGKETMEVEAIIDPAMSKTVRDKLIAARDEGHSGAASVFLGVVTLASVFVLFLWDTVPALFPDKAHDLLGALPLALIALAYLVYQIIKRPAPAELLKAVLLAAAFLLWAANQFWPEGTHATLLNDLAIGLFVLDVFFVIVGWPNNAPNESFAKSYMAPAKRED